MLVNCTAYKDGTKLAELKVDEISEYVARPGCFVWVALRDASDDDIEQMRHEFGLHELAVEDAKHGHQRPKIEEYGDIVFAVMHTVEFSPTHELSVGEIHVFAGPNFVLSVRNHSEQGFISVRQRAEHEPHLLRHGSGYVLYALMDTVVDRYFPVIDALEADLEDVEAQIFARGMASTNVERLYELKRKIGTVKHAVAPLMEASGKLISGRVPAVCGDTRAYFRDVHDHLTRINATLEALRDTISTAIQVNLSMVAIEESEVNKRLTAWAGIFAVASLFGSIWGMNFKYMPELQFEYGYPFALATIAIACGLLYRAFKRHGWL
jgi:magnesium transporter